MIIFDNKLFTNPMKIIKAFDNEEFINAFNEIENLKQKYYLCGYIRYEAKDIFLNKKIKSDFPLLYFEVFENFKPFMPQKAENIHLNVKPDISFEEYNEAIKKIKQEISEGNTYEVNFTYDFNVECDQKPIEIYNFLLNKQKTPYNFYTENEYDTILSFSPELFFEIKNNHITTKPMKGTIHRGKDEIEDTKLKNFLKNDIKNRSENVMIVDLLRNDLGRIAKTGSVKVTKLFEIETHQTLHQMTSQIEADIKEDTTIFDIFQAIYPCGSITGAPKISTMKIIEETEKGQRNIYCGAIGLITPEKTLFSVPIRILQKTNKEKCYKYRAGGAIVWDSSIQDEWNETITKTKFINDNFCLIETIKIENGKMLLKDEHFKRLKKSAKYFNFKFDDKIMDIKPEKDGIMRILLNKKGCYTVEYKELKQLENNKISISPIVINSNENFIYHKTTYRPWFFDSYNNIVNNKIYDEIFFNEKGEMTEGARSNIVLKIDGKYYTPPLTSGLLNGIYRQKMLENNDCTEKVLYKSDLLNAEKILCINSVRGIQEVILDTY